MHDRGINVVHASFPVVGLPCFRRRDRHRCKWEQEKPTRDKWVGSRRWFCSFWRGSSAHHKDGRWPHIFPEQWRKWESIGSSAETTRWPVWCTFRRSACMLWESLHHFPLMWRLVLGRPKRNWSQHKISPRTSPHFTRKFKHQSSVKCFDTWVLHLGLLAFNRKNVQKKSFENILSATILRFDVEMGWFSLSLILARTFAS